MEKRQIVLPLTVHLLASTGDSLTVQQAVDQLLHVLCPNVLLFLVSERTVPVMSYGCHKKKFEFPGVSVTLFLHEDLGEERISRIYDYFQLSPWNHINTEMKQRRISDFNQAPDDFYSIDTHMPVWGIRQVHYGTEIVRLTLYCSFDNYDEAVSLYETILQMEAASQKTGFCFFVLYSTKDISIQLSLKQLPPGISAEVKDACALQFMVHAIGQLVPLLPYPCVPISDTRWQTQDYDGNKILLLVTDGTTVTKDQLDNKDDTPQTFSFMRLPRTLKSQKHINVGHCKQKHTSNILCNTSDHTRDSYLCSRWPEKLVSKIDLQFKETETNVDTGYTAVNLRDQQAFLNIFSTDHNMPISEDSSSFRAGCKAPIFLPTVHEDSFTKSAAKRNKGFDTGNKMFHMESLQMHNCNSKLQEDAFYI
ncbi:protein FAM124B [Bombina bombina]|uniref:protein FAM124B n=1 Tax=Bombina bombina TaxID=8345 RepID=UPI00235AAB3A|nr:protein FAM124B [Bombina bombina]